MVAAAGSVIRQCFFLHRLAMATSILDQPVMVSLDPRTYHKLGGDLTLRSPMNRDWAGLADRVGFSSKQVELLQQYDDKGTCNM